MKSLALVGFMGSGKTTVSFYLAKHYNLKQISVDREIENSTGKSVGEIFSEFGEKYFRELEHGEISRHLEEKCIFDLGGGAFIQKRNRNLLEKFAVKTVFLDVPFGLICRRLENERNTRPLLSGDNWKKKALALLEERYGVYSKANICIRVKENDSALDIVSYIVKTLENEKS
ncbi:MAG: shikimate kinase [Rickettsiales bacterium]|jgi:shikimate kinase|nr:shikimate kinase [Rickettsiales bacterium]